MYFANLGLMSNDPSKSTQLSNSSTLIDRIIESNCFEIIDAGPNIFNASQLI